MEEPREKPKRMTEELWVRLMDLPGYEEWIKDYDRYIEKIVGEKINDFHMLIHPSVIEKPPEGYFDDFFQRCKALWVIPCRYCWVSSVASLETP